ncbi:hypothetical protein MUK42_03410 [Musa troglodytarum]|uniref:Uncharacterized protein n=1 Tax=Musa troglodytarum TaxID=320322 RepID=A0A9E7HCH3_9LILI|nr:hypothetical protein MUK42_03410 [Musa troglodytarum]
MDFMVKNLEIPCLVILQPGMARFGDQRTAYIADQSMCAFLDVAEESMGVRPPSTATSCMGIETFAVRSSEDDREATLEE